MGLDLGGGGEARGALGEVKDWVRAQIAGALRTHIGRTWLFINGTAVAARHKIDVQIAGATGEDHPELDLVRVALTGGAALIRGWRDQFNNAGSPAATSGSTANYYAFTSSTTVTLTFTPGMILGVAKNGVVIDEGPAWTSVDKVLTFAVALGGSDTIAVWYLIGGALPPTTIPSVVGTGKVLSLWNGSSNDPAPSNWEMVGFSDGAWSATAAGGGTLTISGAAMLWAPGGLAHTGERILVRHTFLLAAGTINSASIEVAADDLVEEVYVNGTFIGIGATTGGHDAPKTLSIAPFLLVSGGSNLFAFMARDTGGGGYDLQYRIDIN